MASPVTPAREGHQPPSPRSAEPVEKKGYQPQEPVAVKIVADRGIESLKVIPVS